MMWPGMANMPDYMGWMMFGSYVLWPVLAVLAVFVIVRLIRPMDGSARGNAKAILDERLARGEIDVEEYRARLSVLGT